MQPKNFSQFWHKNSKIYGFCPYLFKKLQFFGGGFFNKDYTFYTKILNYNERCPKYRKYQLFSNIFTFLSVIRQNFAYNLRILANFRIKTQNLRISLIPFQKTSFFFNFLIKMIFFTLKIYFYNERCPKVHKNQFFSNIFTFLSVIHQNFEYNLRILANFGVKTRKSMDFALTF